MINLESVDRLDAASVMVGDIAAELRAVSALLATRGDELSLNGAEAHGFGLLLGMLSDQLEQARESLEWLQISKAI